MDKDPGDLETYEDEWEWDEADRQVAARKEQDAHDYFEQQA